MGCREQKLPRRGQAGAGLGQGERERGVRQCSGRGGGGGGSALQRNIMEKVGILFEEVGWDRR